MQLKPTEAEYCVGEAQSKFKSNQSNFIHRKEVFWSPTITRIPRNTKNGKTNMTNLTKIRTITSHSRPRVGQSPNKDESLSGKILWDWRTYWSTTSSFHCPSSRCQHQGTSGHQPPRPSSVSCIEGSSELRATRSYPMDSEHLIQKLGSTARNRWDPSPGWGASPRGRRTWGRCRWRRRRAPPRPPRTGSGRRSPARWCW